MMSSDQSKRVIVCITGSIAAYKMPDYLGQLVEQGVTVKVLLTKSAEQFVTPLTMAVKSGQHVVQTLSDYDPATGIEHIELAKWADLIVVAPATANIIAKLAGGFADDTVSCTCLTTRKQVLIFPAMNTDMWQDEITQRNVKLLNDTAKYQVFEPEEGLLACGVTGSGRLRGDIIDIILNKFEQQKTCL